MINQIRVRTRVKETQSIGMEVHDKPEKEVLSLFKKLQMLNLV